MKWERSSQAVSEIIGTVLLLAIAVALFSVIYTSVLSNPASEYSAPPIILGELKENSVLLHHQGGPSLSFAEYSIIIDAGDQSYISTITYDHNENERWDIGERIIYEYSTLQQLTVEVTVINTRTNEIILTGILQEGTQIELDTRLIPLAFYEYTSFPIMLSAVNTTQVESVSLWFDYSFDNSSWDGWRLYQNDTNGSDGWSWEFHVPNDYGFYRFYSIGHLNNESEQPPLEADTSCYYNPPFSLNTSVDQIQPYTQTSEIPLNATGDKRLTDVSLYYQYSEDNKTWSGEETQSGYKVQQGYTRITSTQQDIAIETVQNISHAFVLLPHAYSYTQKVGGTSLNANSGAVSAYLFNETTLRVNRESDVNDIWFSWQVIECFDEEFTVYRGDDTYSAAKGNSWSLDIGSIVTPEHCMALVIATNNNNGRSKIAHSMFYANVTSSTELTIYRDISDTISGSLRWIVVEWDVDKIDSFQRGATIVERHSPTSRNQVTLNTNINTSTSLLLWQFACNKNGLLQLGIAGNILNTSTIEFYPHDNNNYVRNVQYYVIDFGSGVESRQQGQVDYSSTSGWSKHTESLTAINTSRTVVFTGTTSSGTGSAFPRPFPNAYLASNTSLIICRNYTGQNSWIEWQVVELPYDDGVDHSIDTVDKWVFDGFSYRTACNISGEQTNLTNITIPLTIYYGQGISSGSNLYLNGSCQNDFDDIRFADDTGSALEYVREIKVDGYRALFWFKVDRLPTTGGVFYVYYGNASVSTTGNASRVFDIWEDFEDSTTIFDSAGGTGISTSRSDSYDTMIGSYAHKNNDAGQAYKIQLDTSVSYNSSFFVASWVKNLGGSGNEMLGPGVSLFGASAESDGYQSIIDCRSNEKNPQLRKQWDYGSRVMGDTTGAIDQWYYVSIHVDTANVYATLYTIDDYFNHTITDQAIMSDSSYRTGYVGIATYNKESSLWDGYRVGKQGTVTISSWNQREEEPTGSMDWIYYDTDSNYPWNWSFSFPNGTGYYEFYSIGKKDTLSEYPPDHADATCYYIYSTELEGRASQWSFDENAGSIVYDAVDERDGDIIGATWTTGFQGSALLFDGLDDTVDIRNDTSFRLNDTFSFEILVSPSSHKTAKLVQNGDWDGHGLGQDIWRGWKGSIYITGDRSYSVEWDEGRPDLGTWYHLVLTYDGSSLRLYVNGNETDNTSVTGSPKNNGRGISIGSDNNNQKFFNGIIDEVTVYERALGPSEVRMRYGIYKV
ncbi:MAG: DUF2341 domain-containing protein [Candidatus Thermoplasmatota archaeon]|nr:DUF2341 domain-containing protein [Candidatus Thermoplasmatota archaeon]